MALRLLMSYVMPISANEVLFYFCSCQDEVMEYLQGSSWITYYFSLCTWLFAEDNFLGLLYPNVNSVQCVTK